MFFYLGPDPVLKTPIHSPLPWLKVGAEGAHLSLTLGMVVVMALYSKLKTLKNSLSLIFYHKSLVV